MVSGSFKPLMPSDRHLDSRLDRHLKQFTSRVNNKKFSRVRSLPVVMYVLAVAALAFSAQPAHAQTPTQFLPRMLRMDTSRIRLAF